MSGKPHKKCAEETPRTGHLASYVLTGGNLKICAHIPRAKMKRSGSNQKHLAVIAVLSVAETRIALLASGQFEVCPGSDNSVIDKETGVQVRLINNWSRN